MLDKADHESKSDQTYQWIFSVFSIIVASASLPGNGWTLFVLSKKFKGVSKCTKSLINLLSLSDILLGFCILVPNAVTLFAGRWVFGDTMCQILAMEVKAVFSTSLITHSVIAFQRYRLLQQPSVRRHHNQAEYSLLKRRAVLVTICMYTHISAFPLMFWTKVSKTGNCGVPPGHLTAVSYHSLVTSIVNGWLPLLAIVISYCLILKRTRQLSKKVLPMGVSAFHWTKSARLTKVCVIMVGFFVLTGFPFQLFKMLGFFQPSSTVMSILTAVMFCLYILYSALCPVLYMMLWNSYKKRSREVYLELKKKLFSI